MVRFSNWRKINDNFWGKILRYNMIATLLKPRAFVQKHGDTYRVRTLRLTGSTPSGLEKHIFLKQFPIHFFMVTVTTLTN